MLANIFHSLRLALGLEEEQSKQDKIDEKYEKLVVTIDEQSNSIQKLMLLLTEDRHVINSLIEVSSYVKEQQDEIVKYIILNDENKNSQDEKNKVAECEDDFVN